MSIPRFKDAVEVEWRHNDFTMTSEVTVSYIVRMRSCIADEESTPERCDWLRDKTIADLQHEVFESAMEEAYEMPLEFGKDAAYCSKCGTYYEGHMDGSHGIGPFVHCPGCGRRLMRLCARS